MALNRHPFLTNVLVEYRTFFAPTGIQCSTLTVFSFGAKLRDKLRSIFPAIHDAGPATHKGEKKMNMAVISN